MRYGSVCSGIEAASVAWAPLGWTPAFFSEIDRFPREVLAQRHPGVPLHGDFTTIGVDDYGPIDLLVGGTPCQSFSVAGSRAGLDDDRGKLALEYILLADRKRPGWVVWENVPGVFSVDDGEAFRCFISGLVRWDVSTPAGGWKNSGVCEPAPVDGAYGVAWRVLDAQYLRTRQHPWAVPQRRRRVFVVGYLGDWRPAAAVLLERESLCGHPPPRREARKADPQAAALRASGDERGGLIAEPIPFDTTQVTSSGNYSWPAHGDPCHPLAAGAHPPAIAFSCKDHGADATDGCAPTLRAMGHDGSHANGGGQLAVAIGFNARQDPDAWVERSGPLDTDGGTQAVAFQLRGRDGGAQAEVEPGGVSPALRAADNGSTRPFVATDYRVRRLTPRECERLQGFPDDYTAIDTARGEAADGPRYKALGNSMTVPVMQWIGERIAMFETHVRPRMEQ